MEYNTGIMTAEEIAKELELNMSKIRKSESKTKAYLNYIKELVSMGYEEELYSEDDVEMSDDIRTAYEGLGYVKDQALTFEDAIKIHEAIDFYVSSLEIAYIADEL